jgi:catecholate siderophore receptor
MKARHRRRKKPRAKTPWVVIGAVVSTIPNLQAAGHRPIPPAALPIERRLTLESQRLEAALAHVKFWTPSETMPQLVPAMQGPPVFQFEIAPGPLLLALRQLEAITGLSVRVADDIATQLTTGGVTGQMTAAQALDRLLAGTSLSHRFTDARTVVVELRIASDSVEVSGSAPRVRSTKYSAPISEIPQTIQVIPRALLDEQGAATLTDALRNVPGITMQAGEGGGASNTSGDMFNMRGFSANNSLFVDGVRDDGLLARDVYNVEQIEVFSGPTGSDVGRTNAAGYINLTTKSPHLEPARTANVGYGAGDQVRATFDVNQPLALDDRGTFFGNAAVRVNVLWQDGGIAGRDYTGRESKAIAPSIAFGLNTSTRLSASGQILRQDNLADYGLPAAASPIGPLTSTSVVAASPVEQDTYYGSPDYDYDRVSQDNVALRLEHDFSPRLTLRNQTRYNETHRTAVVTSIQNAAAYDPATNLVTLSRQANERRNQILSNQTALNGNLSTGGVRHDVSFGLDVASERQFAPTLGGVGTRGPVDLHRPDVFSPVIGMNIAPTGALAEGRTDTIAVYVFDAFDLGRRVRLNGGVRVERYRTRSHAVTANGLVTDVEGDGTLVTGKAGLVYRLSEKGNLYAAYGSSQLPPGSANFQLNAAPGNQNNPNVDPQESTNYEAGTKWDLANGRFHVTGAFFWTENRNVIFVVDPLAVPPIFNQDDAQRVRGVEIGAIGRITPWWEFNLNVLYLDSEARSQNPALDGRRLILAPEFSAQMWTAFRLPRGIRLGGGIRHLDATFVNAANTTMIPAYSVADALAEIPIAQRLTVRLNVYNVTDRVYIRNINNNAGRYNPGTPRSFLLSTAVRF